MRKIGDIKVLMRNIKIGISIFAYNRSWHLQQVLDGLQKNENVDKLYIFQDGLKYETHRQEWEKVKKIIENISWCEKVCIFSDKNKGLAKSVVDGVNYVLRENDTIIVLEDDCVPTINFVAFMKQCFEKYSTNKKVYSVTGYSWPIELPKDFYDIYGCGRISSWGWGTWKDRWEQYVIDNTAIKYFKEDKYQSKELAIWGNDLEQIIIKNISGETDSWAIYWALMVIKNGGICINPYKSLINNIGMDGTGVHCGINKKFQVETSEDLSMKFILPDKIEILDTTKIAFADLYGSYTAINKKDKIKKCILVYGLGNFYLQNEKYINKEYYIEAFVDRKKKGWFGGKRILPLNEIKNYNYEKIIIMIQDIQECFDVIKEMIYLNIEMKKVILGHSLYGKYSKEIDEIYILPDGKLLLKVRNIQIKINSKDEFNNICEVLLYQTYNYCINNKKRDIILDVGMNIGDATLYFLNRSHVEKVYGFEPFEQTFESARENLEIYLNDTNRLEIFRYGISNENTKRLILFNALMTCGQSTLEDAREKAYLSYFNLGLIKQKDENIEEIEVRKATEVFEPIIKKYPDYNIVLKMDCEGEEYGILEDLLQSGILSKITFIMLEWHYKGKDSILNCLKQAGFSWWCNDKEENMGLVYAYKGQ